MTREEWLQLAVEKLNSNLFNDDLDLLNHKYQISAGLTPWNKPNHVLFPYDGPDPTLDDFYPPTIIINHQIKDPVAILESVAAACIRAFFNHKREDRKFRKHAEEYYFEYVDKKLVATDYLKSILNGIYGVMVKNYGDYPGKAVVEHKKEPKSKDSTRQSNVIKMFCPSCSYETKTSRKIFEKYGQKCPTCVCGTQMAVDLSDENSEDKGE